MGLWDRFSILNSEVRASRKVTNLLWGPVRIADKTDQEILLS